MARSLSEWQERSKATYSESAGRSAGLLQLNWTSVSTLSWLQVSRRKAKISPLPNIHDRGHLACALNKHWMHGLLLLRDPQPIRMVLGFMRRHTDRRAPCWTLPERYCLNRIGTVSALVVHSQVPRNSLRNGQRFEMFETQDLGCAVRAKPIIPMDLAL